MISKSLFTMCILFPGHSMRTTNQRSFKSPERSGIKWRSWSYLTWLRKSLFFLYFFFRNSRTFLCEKQTGTKRPRVPLDRWHQKKKKKACVCSAKIQKAVLASVPKTLEVPQNWLSGFVCECVWACVRACANINQYCSLSGAIMGLYSSR